MEDMPPGVKLTKRGWVRYNPYAKQRERNREKIAKIFKKTPWLTFQQVADIVGISKQRVHKLAGPRDRKGARVARTAAFLRRFRDPWAAEEWCARTFYAQVAGSFKAELGLRNMKMADLDQRMGRTVGSLTLRNVFTTRHRYFADTISRIAWTLGCRVEVRLIPFTDEDYKDMHGFSKPTAFSRART